MTQPNSAHSYTEGYQLDLSAGCQPNQCHFPNCQCSGPPTKAEPNSLPEQLHFISGMRKLLAMDGKVTIVVDQANLPIITAIEQQLQNQLQCSAPGKA
jgi:hypothetical protein